MTPTQQNTCRARFSSLCERTNFPRVVSIMRGLFGTKLDWLQRCASGPTSCAFTLPSGGIGRGHFMQVKNA